MLEFEQVMILIIGYGCSVQMAGHWQSYFVGILMDLDCVPAHKYAQKQELDQYLAIFT